jgi:dipeptidyl aminopeptidase/acylaminoacyl peptidase
MEIPAPHPITSQDVVEYRVPRDANISPDGQFVIYTLLHAAKSTTPERPCEIWLADVASSQSHRLTFGQGTDQTPRWSPDSQSIAFLSDRLELGQRQIYIMNVKGGEAHQLTQLQGELDSPIWSADGQEIIFLHRLKQARDAKQGDDRHVEDENPAYRRVWAVNIDTGVVHPLTPDGYEVHEFVSSPDDKHVALVAKQGDITTSGWYTAQLYIVDRNDPSNPHQLFSADRQICGLAWSPDNCQVAYMICRISDPPLWQGDVCTISIDGGEPRQITSRDIPLSITKLDWRETNTMVFGARQLDGTSFGRLNVSTGQVETLWTDYATIGDWTVPRISLASDNNTFATILERPDTPAQVYVGTLKTASESWKQVSQFEYAPLRMGRMETVRWCASDGLEIVGHIVYPVDYQPGKRYPTFVQIHGGPTWSWLPHYAVWWEWWYQYLAGRGYLVFLPNIRGSAGGGTDYAEANYRDMGGKDWEDVMQGIDHIVELGLADADRLGIGGWSYGGFMTAWAVTQTTRFKVAIMGAGITNWESYFAQNSIRDWQTAFFGSTPYEDPEAHRAKSPLTFINQVRTPTLILHGQEDHDVSLPQAYEMYVALKTLGIPTELVTYPRENHPILEREHQIDLLRRVGEWCDKYMKAL